jgi:hypothetical protein
MHGQGERILEGELGATAIISIDVKIMGLLNVNVNYGTPDRKSDPNLDPEITGFMIPKVLLHVEIQDGSTIHIPHRFCRNANDHDVQTDALVSKFRFLITFKEVAFTLE